MKTTYEIAVRKVKEAKQNNRKLNGEVPVWKPLKEAKEPQTETRTGD